MEYANERDRPAASLPVLRAVLDARLTDEARRWLVDSSAVIEGRRSSDHFFTIFTLAARKVGKADIALDGLEQARLHSLGISWMPASRLDQWTRVFLLVLGYSVVFRGLPRVVEDCFLSGDLDERCAVLRSLPLLSGAEFVPLALEACRTNIEPIFTAIACENPYPVSYFPDAAFHRMVLKALFLGIPVKRIIGLERRRGPELTRMALDLVSERRAAGRSVPVDLRDVIDPALAG